MVELTTLYFSHLSHLKFSNTGFSHAVCDAYVFFSIAVVVINLKQLRDLFGILSAKNPWGSICTQKHTLQYERVYVVDSTGLGRSGRL
jgi:hypothetical protein